jgi:hypothetical protein
MSRQPMVGGNTNGLIKRATCSKFAIAPVLKRQEK